VKNNDPWVDDELRWKDPEYLKWLKEIWHVEIKEDDPRHLWPGQWIIQQDEKDLYNKYEKEWYKRRQEDWDKKHHKNIDNTFVIQPKTSTNSLYLQEGEDYFHWNVESPGWLMHRNGSWQKMLINMDYGTVKTTDQYPGIFNSYEHACKTLANYCDLSAPRFALGELTDYEKHLKDFANNYNYEK